MRRLLLAGLIWAASGTLALGAVVDGVVAAIDQRVIARSLLETYRATFAPEAGWREALDRMIDERLLAREARRYALDVPSEAVAEARADAPRPAHVTEAEWEMLWHDHLAAARFLEFRFGEFVPVPRDAVRAYYEANRARYPQPFEEVEEAIREALVPGVRREREATFVSDLRVRADVRVNAGLLPGE